jgi:hypothetical protein
VVAFGGLGAPVDSGWLEIHPNGSESETVYVADKGAKDWTLPLHRWEDAISPNGLQGEYQQHVLRKGALKLSML